MGSIQRSSTAQVEERHRISYWNGGASLLGAFDAEAIGHGAFNAKVATRTMGAMIVYGLEAGPHRVVWSRSDIDGRDEAFLRVRFQRTGISIVETESGRIVVHPGEWSVVDGSRSHVIHNREQASVVSFQIPHSQLTDRDIKAARRMAGPFPTAGGISHLLYQCLRLAIEDLEYEQDSTDQELGESMLDMFRIILHGSDYGGRRATMRETAQTRVRALIRRNLTDPALSVAGLATAMKCSRRYVHKLFEGGDTVSQFILFQRLEACRRQLLEDGAQHRTLTEVAFEYGFRSSAHFSRAFRARFGRTPSEYRAAAARMTPSARLAPADTVGRDEA
jgi:AraC-like DNA-binding protein